MSQLIALIIAIALGAIVTAIGYVFLGDAFTKNSEKGKALQFISQASQVQMAMTAYYAENAGTSFDTDWATTQTALKTNGYLKSGLKSPFGEYVMVGDSSGVYLFVEDTTLTDTVCQQINKIAGLTAYTILDQAIKATADTNGEALMPTALITTTTHAKDALNGNKFSCSETFAAPTSHTFIYEVQ